LPRGAKGRVLNGRKIIHLASRDATDAMFKALVNNSDIS